jgi:penicillin-insensitive murein endopeptidase
MLQRIFWAVLALLLISAVSCAPSHKERQGARTFVTHGPQTAESDAGGTRKPPPASKSLATPAAVAPLLESEESHKTIAPLLLQEERTSDIPEFKISEPVRQWVAREIPELSLPAQTVAFKVERHQLTINVKTSAMTFTGLLKIPDKADEELELRCSFDKAKSWVCANMFPTNPKIAAERRLQATANCTDLYRCDQIAIELFVMINGKIESQMFQSGHFAIRRASSGDVPEDSGQAPPAEERELTPEELNKIVGDPNATVEVEGPIPTPAPIRGEFSIPNIEQLRPDTGAHVASQAIGIHTRGHLKDATQLPKQGPGFAVRSGADRSYGTNLMVDLIQQAAGAMEKTKPNHSPIMVADISQRYGGRLGNRSGNFHLSHQTGLDADIAFPSNKVENDLWPAFASGRMSDKFDEERTWAFISAMTCAEDSPVIAIFIDTGIKQHLCRWAKSRMDISNPSSCAFKTLRALRYSPGHHNHMHVRLRCPGNVECRNATVSLGRTTGC